jgi:hypothetical protein
VRFIPLRLKTLWRPGRKRKKNGERTKTKKARKRTEAGIWIAAAEIVIEEIVIEMIEMIEEIVTEEIAAGGIAAGEIVTETGIIIMTTTMMGRPPCS